MPVARRNQAPENLWQSITPQQSVRHFETAVIQFHYLRRTPIRQLPYVLGKKINLRKLYVSVIKKGGYKKVNKKELWEDVLSELNLPKEGTNCELAIQTIYHRYLEDYERDQWTSINSSSHADTSSSSPGGEINLSRHSTYISELGIRDRSVLASFVYDNTPKIYSDYQHIVSNHARLESGLSCNLREATEFRHLTMSLKSGLCNEIDFSLNTLLIMSSTDRVSLDLRFTGDLIDMVIATSGIVDTRPGSFFEQFKDCSWMQDSLKFWNKTVEAGVGRIFLVPNIFACSRADVRRIQRYCNTAAGNSELFNGDNQYHRIVDPCCHRIHLVATIVRNLTVDSLFNCQTIVSSDQTLRFLLLGAHSRDSVLRRLCLHTLSKLRFVLSSVPDGVVTGLKSLLSTPDLQADTDKDEDGDQEWFTEFLLDFLVSLLSSEDRGDRISAYEMIQTLCLIEDNHETLSKYLQSQFITKISSQLLVPDIHPLSCALEALLALSQLGDDICRRMAMCSSLLKCLLQFVNIEAQMFGPSAVYKIKTFNSRPPIPVTNYHSLPQVMRLPPPSPMKSLASLAPSVTPFVPNCSQPPIRSPHTNSISPYSLSNPPPTAMQTHQHDHTKSQLTPLQQIDHLLTKSIASFATPQDLSEEVRSRNCVIESPQLGEREEMSVQLKGDEEEEKMEKEEEKEEEEKEEEEKDKEEEEHEDMNGLSNGTVYDRDSSETISEHYVYQNGTLELEVADEEDPDRRQMPPPSLPTPSMLKKQMRPKLSPHSAQMGVTNGYVPQMNCKENRLHGLSDTWTVTTTTMTTTTASVTTQEDDEDKDDHDQDLSLQVRCDQVKRWLRKNFQLTDDVKLFVSKQRLVEDLVCSLSGLDGSENGALLPAQELHDCVKDVFGNKVQVKVEHGVNGNTHLIYSHLSRIESTDIDKSSTNGFVNTISELNGITNHATKRKNHNSEIDVDRVEHKKLCEDQDREEEKEEIQLKSSCCTDVDSVLTKKSNVRRRRRTPLRFSTLRKRMIKSKKKAATVVKSKKPSSADDSGSSSGAPLTDETCSVTKVSCTAGHIYCLWSTCSHTFADFSSLQIHITNDHLNTNIQSRTQCQWRECQTSYIQRAPLSLLSHVIQDHCNVPYAASFHSQSAAAGAPNHNNIYPTAMSPHSANPPSFNQMLPSNMKHGNATANQHPVLEKSGWSVLYDHFRSEEQSQQTLPEGPITKHIRISSSIILRNMSRHSIIAKEFLRSHEKFLATVALSGQDCSSVIVQCLDELRLPTTVDDS